LPSLLFLLLLLLLLFLLLLRLPLGRALWLPAKPSPFLLQVVRQLCCCLLLGHLH
jgi:hypothetical protein